MSYYGVRRGRVPGVYLAWEDCRQQVHKFAGAEQKKFGTRAEAEAFVASATGLSTRKRGADEPSDREQKEPRADERERERKRAKLEHVEALLAERDAAAARDADTYILYTDGGSRGNPGLAAGAAVLWRADRPQELLVEEAVLVGRRATNNEAEYGGFVLGLERALERGAKKLEARLDSKLVVKQMQGAYGVHAETLVPLHRRARELAAKFEAFSIMHVPRKFNSKADSLCNAFMDRMEKEG